MFRHSKHDDTCQPYVLRGLAPQRDDWFQQCMTTRVTAAARKLIILHISIMHKTNASFVKEKKVCWTNTTVHNAATIKRNDCRSSSCSSMVVLTKPRAGSFSLRITGAYHITKWLSKVLKSSNFKHSSHISLTTTT